MVYRYLLFPSLICLSVSSCSPSAEVKVCMEHTSGMVKPCSGKSNWWTQAESDAAGSRTGTRLVKVEKNSDAYQMGFRTGDVIKAINGKAVSEFYSPCAEGGVSKMLVCYKKEQETLKGGIFFDKTPRYLDVLVQRSGKDHHVIYEVYSQKVVRRGI